MKNQDKLKTLFSLKLFVNTISAKFGGIKVTGSAINTALFKGG